MTLSTDQLRALEIVERCASALSIGGILTIIVTFFSSRYFRNPIDRLILINAFYNVLDITATMISLSGPSAGNGSTLCQLQGFLMQMFPLADVLWTLAMALDVFLIVYYQYDANALRKLELKYISGITAITFIPAFVFIFVQTPDKGHMYGSVTLWCAISPNWVLYRILFYYGPIWLAVAIVIVLYGLVGWKIVKGKRALRSVESNVISLDLSQAAEKDDDDIATPSPNRIDDGGASSSVTSSTAAKAWSHDGTESVSPLRPPDTPNSNYNYNHKLQANQSALSLRQYILMPVMFFVVLLFIWVAPTTNRLASFVDPTFVSYPLYIAVGSTGSLRGFWNGIVFLAVGLRSRQSQRQLEAGRRRQYR